MAEGTKVTIDRDGCVSCSLCWTTCPEFFEPNPEDDRSQVVDEYRADNDPGTGVAPDGLLAAVQEAADACPVEVIHIA